MSDAHRPAAVAGTFYPADPERLGRLIDTLLAGAAAAAQPASVASAARPAGPGMQAIVGGLVPHAGLVYSGAIAALTWKLAGEIAPATVVLAGTDHQALAAGVGVWTGGPWRTPLGDVPVDGDLALRIAGLGPPFAPDDDAHLLEHSLEVQLPLLLRACPGARIVPLAVSPRLRGHADAGARLGRLLGELRSAADRVFLIASSDMAHYPPARVCEEVDDRLLVPLLELDGDALDELEAAILRAGMPGLVCGLCGIDPVRFTLAAVAEMGATHGILLGKATSADAGGDPRRTVGYAAAAFA
jgi:AmmeMemoRadiSam system protein B